VKEIKQQLELMTVPVTDRNNLAKQVNLSRRKTEKSGRSGAVGQAI